MKKLSERMEAAQEVLDGERVRWLLGKKTHLTQDENVYGKQIAENRYELILANAALTELERKLILREIAKEPKSSVEVAGALDMEPSDVLRHFIALRKWHLAEDAGERDGALLFRATPTKAATESEGTKGG